MANKIRGEAVAKTESGDWKIVVDMNAIAGFEDATDTSWALFEGRARAGTSRISDLRHLCHQALLRHQPTATLADAGDILSEDMDAFNSAMEAAFPAAEESDGEPGNETPAA